MAVFSAWVLQPGVLVRNTESRSGPMAENARKGALFGQGWGILTSDRNFNTALPLPCHSRFQEARLIVQRHTAQTGPGEVRGDFLPFFCGLCGHCQAGAGRVWLPLLGELVGRRPRQDPAVMV